MSWLRVWLNRNRWWKPGPCGNSDPEARRIDLGRWVLFCMIQNGEDAAVIEFAASRLAEMEHEYDAPLVDAIAW